MHKIYYNSYLNLINQWNNNIILETKQQFSLIDNKEEIIKLFEKILLQLQTKNISSQDIIFDYQYFLAKLIYKSIRYKSKLLNQTNIQIDNQILFNFYLTVTKNVKSYADINQTWVKFLYSKDLYFYARKTYSKYITPNINYTQQDLNILQDALLNLQNITKELSIQYNTNLGIKYNTQFKQYFQQNDNIKLYCFKPEDIHILDQIETKFLNLLPNKENNRIYTNGIDDGFSFGEKLSKNIAKEILNYLIYNKCTPNEVFQFLKNNFEKLIIKYSNINNKYC